MSNKYNSLSNLTLIALLIMSFLHCEKKLSKDFLGSAIAESITVTPSTIVGGELIFINNREGDRIKAGQMIAMVDTIPLTLKLKEVEATKIQLREEKTAFQAEQASLKEKISGVKRELDRVSELVKKGAVPTQKEDQLATEYLSLQHKVTAISHKIKALQGKNQLINAKKEQLKYQLKNCRIYSPFDGLVLTVYKQKGEIIGPGNPVIEIGKYDTLQVDFFIPQILLAELKVDLAVTIRCDTDGKTPLILPGYINWINSEAEFVPENIQTRDARNGLVFRVRAMVPNINNTLKRGLPVEVWRVSG